MKWYIETFVSVFINAQYCNKVDEIYGVLRYLNKMNINSM